jgi:hypothetical protein
LDTGAYEPEPGGCLVDSNVLVARFGECQRSGKTAHAFGTCQRGFETTPDLVDVPAPTMAILIGLSAIIPMPIDATIRDILG